MRCVLPGIPSLEWARASRAYSTKGRPLWTRLAIYVRPTSDQVASPSEAWNAAWFWYDRGGYYRMYGADS